VGAKVNIADWDDWRVGDKIIMYYTIYTIDSIKGAVFIASNPDYGTENGIVGNYKNLRTDFGAGVINHHSD